MLLLNPCSSASNFGADETWPLLNYILLKYWPLKMQSNINFIKAFTSPQLSKSEPGVLIANLEMGVQFVDGLSGETVKGLQKGEWERRIH